MRRALQFFALWCTVSMFLMSHDGVWETIGFAMLPFSVIAGFVIMGRDMKCEDEECHWYLVVGFAVTMLWAGGMSRTLHSTPEIIGVAKMCRGVLNWTAGAIVIMGLIEHFRTKRVIRATATS